MAPVQFLDELPAVAKGSRGPRPLAPEIVEFLGELQENPGKWAQYPVERKTKPDLPEGFATARRSGTLYASYQGE